MRIVHYITDFTTAAGPQSAAARKMLLATALRQETHLVTSVRLTQAYEKALEEQWGVKVYYVSRGQGINPLTYLGSLITIRSMLKELKPDIVHVHGAWDWTAAIVESCARHHKAVTVVSPHRQLSPAILGIDFWKKKLPRIIAYEFIMIRKCTTTVVINQQEHDDIEQLGIKKRIEILPPLPDDDMSLSSISDTLLEVYQKGLDSIYHRIITSVDKNLVEKAVCAVNIDDDVTLQSPSTDGINFRRVFLYAYDEDVSQQLVDGCKKLGVNLPAPLDVATLPRYNNPRAKHRGPLDDALTPQKELHLPDSKTQERQAVILILNAHNLGWKRLTLRHYVDLYHLFRTSDFNEDDVAAELRRLGQRKFTQALQKHLTKMFALKSGYYIF